MNKTCALLAATHATHLAEEAAQATSTTSRSSAGASIRGAVRSGGGVGRGRGVRRGVRRSGAATAQATQTAEETRTARATRAAGIVRSAAVSRGGGTAGGGAAAGAFLSLNALGQPGNGLGDFGLVCEVTRSNQKGATANTIGSVADGESLVLREVRDLAVLLTIASVSVEHDASHLGLGCFRQASDGSDHDGCTLRVTATHDNGVGAFRGGQVEHFLGLAVGSGAGAVSGKSVGSKAGVVSASDTLAGYLAWEFLLEATASGGTKGRALVNVSSRKHSIFDRSMHTMLPISVEPRA